MADPTDYMSGLPLEFPIILPSLQDLFHLDFRFQFLHPWLLMVALPAIKNEMQI